MYKRTVCIMLHLCDKDLKATAYIHLGPTVYLHLGDRLGWSTGNNV